MSAPPDILAAAEQWRISVDALAEPMCLLDASNRILRCNRALAVRLGRPYAGIVGRSCRECLCARCAPDCALAQARATGRRAVGETQAGDRWYRMVADPVASTGGAVLMLADITDRKRSELLYTLLMDSIPSSVLLLDPELRVVLANRKFLEKARRQQEDTLGKPLKDVFPEVILQELGLERQVRQVFRENRAAGGHRLTYRAPGVPIRVYYYTLVPIGWASRVEHVMLMMEDITEQTQMSEEIRRMERHLAGVVESTGDMVVSTDTAGRILTWNKAAERITGFSFPEARGVPLFDFFDQPDRAGVRQVLEGSGGSGEWNLRTRGGACLPAAWVFSPMQDDQGRTTGFVAAGRDLTERRKFERQLLQSHKLAALGVMAGGIAHEIRTPLTISSSAAQFLTEEDIAPEFRRECAEKVHVGIQRASAIIENLLRFSHPSETAERAPVDVAAVVRDAVALVASQAGVQRVTVQVRLPKGRLLVLGSASMLEQVFLNLFLNALRAMPDGGSLEVTAERPAAEVLLRVRDTGHGIAREDLGNIFDPFYTKAPVGQGTGLGLSLCYSILQQHRGSIEVESELGQGTVFTVRLPVGSGNDGVRTGHPDRR